MLLSRNALASFEPLSGNSDDVAAAAAALIEKYIDMRKDDDSRKFVDLRQINELPSHNRSARDVINRKFVKDNQDRLSSFFYMIMSSNGLLLHKRQRAVRFMMLGRSHIFLIELKATQITNDICQNTKIEQNWEICRRSGIAIEAARALMEFQMIPLATTQKFSGSSRGRSWGRRATWLPNRLMARSATPNYDRRDANALLLWYHSRSSPVLPTLHPLEQHHFT